MPAVVVFVQLKQNAPVARRKLSSAHALNPRVKTRSRVLDVLAVPVQPELVPASVQPRKTRFLLETSVHVVPDPLMHAPVRRLQMVDCFLPRRISPLRLRT